MNIYEKIGLKKVINASGKMTALGASAISKDVGDTMKEAAMNYVDIEELIQRAGELISRYTLSEDSCVTLGASAGIAISTAAVIARDNLSLIERLPRSEGLQNEIIIQKGHCINFGASLTQMIALGGGVPVEVGQSNKVTKKHIEEAINKNTAAIIYVKSHHAVQKGMVSMEDMIIVAKENQIPFILDCAAEEDLLKYVKMDADLVVYSGGKAIEGPTSGFVTGKKELIHYCKMQYKGIGRAMKVGKENIMGLLKALENYENRDAIKIVEDQKEVVEWMASKINAIEGLQATITVDEAGREIYRVKVKTDTIKVTELIKKLENGNPAIYTRNHYANMGIINIDPRPLNAGDEEEIVQQLELLMAEERNEMV
ncbi:DgaE family pyridoxal phosphate-dependent ammonia lyase [Alkalibaculum sp. M08DMB]|uniref:DgaE family pyridoxal phosphate-dependent ammonia lyase n=1 Tax=Alkalibaculum sporogenes TaxID=2655001 RepID=A0A6A7K838_9FIRM|nr:DgaE family pyridoxal phosphate-dependent ammonia lyase [Alkalibaculum sporogenes]